MRDRLFKLAAAACFAAFIFALPGTARAQNPEGRAAAPEAASAKSDQERTAAGDLSQLLDVLNSLRDQVAELTSEVRGLRKMADHNNTQMELMLTQERAGRVDDNIAALNQRQAELADTERALQARQDNIDQELTYKSPINRDDAKEEILSEISNGFDKVHAQEAANSKRLDQLQSESTRLHAHIDDLRKRLEADQDKPQPQP